MSTRAIAWSYLTFVMAVPAVSLAGVHLAGSSLDFAAKQLIAAGAAVLTAAGAVGWAAAFTRAARSQHRATVAVWIATACLAVGFGSFAHTSWEQYQAGMALPIIDLFLCVIPLGLAVLLGAAVAASRSRGERER